MRSQKIHARENRCSKKIISRISKHGESDRPIAGSNFFLSRLDSTLKCRPSVLLNQAARTLDGAGSATGTGSPDKAAFMAMRRRSGLMGFSTTAAMPMAR